MSTARYTNAGPPGTGTTIDNMDSRNKAWGIIVGAGTGSWGTFNVSSISDTGIGRCGVVFAAPINLPAPVCSSDGGENGTYNTTATDFNLYANNSAGVATDPGVYNVVVGGRL